MGKRAREKKLQKIEVFSKEKKEIEERKRSRLAPTIKIVKKLAITCLLTAFLIWIGLVVNGHLPTIVSKVGGKG